MRNYETLRSYNNGKGNLYRFTEQNKNGETIEFSIERCGDWIESRMVIDFDFMFEATEENKQKLIAEIEKRAFQTFERVRKA